MREPIKPGNMALPPNLEQARVRAARAKASDYIDEILEAAPIPKIEKAPVQTDVLNERTVGSRKFYVWDTAPVCTHYCPVYDRCSQKDRDAPCKIMLAYGEGLTNLLTDAFGDRIDDSRMYRVTMHLLPLYRILGRMIIEELSVTNLIVETKNKTIVHPIYQEMTKLVLTIERIWGLIGLTPEKMIAIQVLMDKAKRGVMATEESDDYYRMLEEITTNDSD